VDRKVIGGLAPLEPNANPNPADPLPTLQLPANRSFQIESSTDLTT